MSRKSNKSRPPRAGNEAASLRTPRARISLEVLDDRILPSVNRIIAENQLPGTPQNQWDIVGAGDQSLQGFATNMSYNLGETASFKINDTSQAAYSIDIYRMGYYGGMGARKVATIPSSQTLRQVQPAPLTNASIGLVDCGNWAVSATWSVPTDAVSGVYFAKLIRADTGGASHVVFVVRDDNGQSDLLFQTSDTTWQAYNTWGGKSLYDDGSTNTVRAYAVSYNRPFLTRSIPGGMGESNWLFWGEYPMVRWLEANGYNVSYSSGVDTARYGAELLEHKAFLSVGHDEYWSGDQRANVEAARAAGVNLAFFSGNEIYWKTRWEPSIDASATSFRTLVCYKESVVGAEQIAALPPGVTLAYNTHVNIPDPSPLWTGLWRDMRFSPPGDASPEQLLTGQLFSVNRGAGGMFGTAIQVPEAFGKMRLWRNTTVATLQPGQVATLANGTLGYEWDEDVDSGFRPDGIFQLSSTTENVPEKLIDPVSWPGCGGIQGAPCSACRGCAVAAGTATHALTQYRDPSGAIVFGAGTVQWSWGLDGTHDGIATSPDVRMRQATVNLFADMGAQPGTLQSGLVAATASTDTTRPSSTITSPLAGATIPTGSFITISGTASDAGGGAIAAVEVSIDGGATWRRATGRANWTYSWAPNVGGTIALKSRAVDDSGNIEIPSAGVSVNVSTANSLVAAYGFDASSGTSVTDSSGRGNTGTATAAAWTTGRFGNALSFNGTSSWVTVADSTSLDLTGGMTLEAWVNLTAINGWENVVMKETATDLAYTLYADDNGSDFSNPRRPSGGLRQTSGLYLTQGSSQLTTNTWTHLAATYDGFALRFYVNGAQTSSLAFTGPIMTSNSPLRIGGNSHWGEYFNGQIDEVRVYNRALSATEIQSDMNTAIGADTTAPTVSSITPVSGATGVAVGENATAAFSESIDPATITGANFELRDSSNALIAAAVTYDVATRVATLNPTASLPLGATFTARVRGGSTGVKDLAGNPLASDFVWSFTTVAQSDTTPPTVTGTSPAAGASGVPTASTVTATFSESVQAGSISFVLRDGANAIVPSTVSYNDATRTATLTPSSALAMQSSYSATVSGVLDLAGNALSTPVSWSFTTVALGNGPFSIWSDTAAPIVSADPDTASIEVGVRFRADSAGFITGLRFYKNALNTGTHVGTLWTNTGTSLGSATFSNETASGWQQVSFASPIAISANTTYVASYHAPNGRYAADENVFASAGIDSGPLHVLANGVDGPNGVYGYGAGPLFPNNVYNATNYWVDVVFTTTDTTPPTVTGVSPANGATGVLANAAVTATFSELVDPATVSSSTFELRDGANALVSATVTYNSATRTATLQPLAALNLAATYSARVRGSGTGVKDLAGNPLAADFTWTFATAAAPPPPTISISDASVTEGDSGSVYATFNVNLSAASTQTVTVTYATADGTATAGSDYTAIPPTVLTFAPGEVSKPIVVAVLGDTTYEGAESFVVNLSSPTNATLADGQGAGTISDNDITSIGSDAFGYTAYIQPYEAIDLVPGTSGVTTVRSTGNNNANTITLANAATFRFYGTSYTSIRVSTNGLVTFGTSNTSATNTNLTTAPTQRAIAVLWDDWVNTSGNAMLLTHYRDTNLDGVNDQLIVEWNNVQGYVSSPSPITFQALFSLNTGTANGDIILNYPDLNAGNAVSDGASATVGIKDTGTQGANRILVSFNAASPFVGSGKAIRIASDATPPTVSITSPSAGATVSGSISVTASASDNQGVAGVQFLLDGANLGAEDTTAPYSVSWNTASASNGTHALTARARDAAGNITVSEVASVTVSNGSAQLGQWSAVMNWPLVAMTTVLLRDGRVLMWDGGPACIGSTSPRVWDPVSNTFTPVPLPYFTGRDDDLFCAGQALMADGRVLVVGGHDCDGPQLGIKMTNIFDPATLTWTRGPDMAYRRWYPTATTLADGRVLVTAGSVNNTLDYVPYPEIYDPVSNTWTVLTQANRTIPNYPFVFQNVDGRVIAAGSDEAAMATSALNVATQSWTTVDPAIIDAGSAVMYRPGMILKAGSSYLSAPTDNGGGVPSKNTTYVLDATQATSAWQQTAPMANARTHLNLTVLPDGNVLATGGSTDIGGVNPANAVYAAEMWSPTSQTWSTMASMQTPRLYHSTALLMPDGRVLVAGGGHNYFNNIEYPNAEYYSPPYLFRGARPIIGSAPATLGYNSGFFIATPDAASIASVVLIRTGSPTHSFNMDQRYIPLTFSTTSGGLNVQAPIDANTAPPGHYMLFIVNADGVPSIAPMVRFAAAYEDSVPPGAPGTLSASGGLSSINLSWSAATDNIAVTGYNIYRSTASGFSPSPANLIGQSATLSFVDTGLAAGTYFYRVAARDAAGNVGQPSNEADAVATGDVEAPSVSLTAPANGATVSGAATIVSANAGDNVGVAGVQFLLDGANLGAEDTAAPYSVSWNTTTATNGSHTLSARARDAAGNTTTSSIVTVTVSNSTGLVAAYGFEEGGGGSATDQSGNGLNGTIANAAWTPSGRFGNALTFNGTNALVTVADANLLDFTTAFTLEAWARPTATSTDWSTLILKERPGGLAYSLYATDGANRPPAGYINRAGTDIAVTGPSTLALNTWTHVAATYDGANLRLYVNGVQAASRAQTGSVTTSGNPLRIGGNSIWGEYFTGQIDEVRIYNRALTSTQIQSDMNTPVGGGGGAQHIQSPAVESGNAKLLTRDEAAKLTPSVLSRWNSLGISAAVLGNVQWRLELADLPGSNVGFTAGHTIWLDRDAAGHGWFVDSTPDDDEEFVSSGLKSAAEGRVDLLTVLAHEFGHLLGMATTQGSDLMGDNLPLGTRRIRLDAPMLLPPDGIANGLQSAERDDIAGIQILSSLPAQASTRSDAADRTVESAVSARDPLDWAPPIRPNDANGPILLVRRGELDEMDADLRSLRWGIPLDDSDL